MAKEIEKYEASRSCRERENFFLLSCLPVLFLLLLLFAMPYRLFLCMAQYRQEELFSASALAGFALAFTLWVLPEKWKNICTLFRKKSFTVPFLLLCLLPLFHIPSFFKCGAAGFFIPYFYLLLPLFGCVFAEEFREKLPKVLAWAGGILLLVTFAGFFWKAYRYHFFHGIAGNKNWNSSLILVTLPFTIFFLYRYLREKKGFSLKTALFITALPAMAGIYILTCIASLGVFFSLVTGTVYMLLLFLPSLKWRKMAVILLGAAAVAGGICFYMLQEKILPAIYESGSAGERLELLKSTYTALAADTPLTGNLFASIENILTGCRTEEYFKVLNPAIRSTHPHNHFLYMMLGFGLFGGFFLWGVFLVFLPVLKSFFLIAEEKGRWEEKLLLLALIMLLAHGQVDLVLDILPNGAIALLLLGLCWERTFCFGREKGFPSEKGADLQKLFPEKGKNLCIVCSLILLLFPVYLAGTQVGVFYAKEKIFYSENLSAEDWEKYKNILVFLAEKKPQLMYDLLLNALKRGKADTALALSEKIRESAVADYARIHSARGQAFLMLGDVERALEEYKLDAERYPSAVLPIYNMIQIASRNGKKELVLLLQKEFARRAELLKMSQKEFLAILANPHNELAPWHYTEGSIYENWKKRFFR